MPMHFVGYRQGQKLDRFAFEQVSDVLEQTDAFIWLTITHPSPQELCLIQEEFSLHELAIEDASSAHQRPKLEEYGDTLFLALHTARL
ncbi:MAG: magnesium transporter, partial [Methylococcaceae bacterium]|nr:magnesium transporter [Methylococcaceae bacterium]